MRTTKKVFSGTKETLLKQTRFWTQSELQAKANKEAEHKKKCVTHKEYGNCPPWPHA